MMAAHGASTVDQAPEFIVRLLAETPSPIDADDSIWDAVLSEAGHEGLIPLLYERLRSIDGTVPARVLAAARERYARNALRNALLLRQLESAIDALHAAAIPVIVLKGAHLAAAVFDTPAVRTMSDIDIMVPLDRLEDAERALVAAGFVAPERVDIETHCRRHSHLPRMLPPGGRGVGLEVHWTIELPASPFAIRPDELWQHARPVRVGTRDALGLRTEHLILHLCLHASYHHRFDQTPLKQLCDVAAVVRRYGDRIDWEFVSDTADRWGAAPYVDLTLLLTRELLGADIPDRVFFALPATAEGDRLLAAARAFILSRSLVVPTAIARAYRARGWLDKLRAFAADVFPPPERLAAIYRLQPGSRRIYLWYVIRPFDLIARQGQAVSGLLLRSGMRRRFQAREENRVILQDSFRTWARARSEGRDGH